MRIFRSPATGTIAYGLVCAASFVPLQWLFGIFFGHWASRTPILLLYLGVYPFLLVRWGEKRLAAALTLFVGGSLAVVLLSPRSTAAWAIGVWIFFLIQSMFFIFFSEKPETGETPPPADPFENARRRAEEILG